MATICLYLCFVYAGTDISEITRKPSKIGKYGHENGRVNKIQEFKQKETKFLTDFSNLKNLKDKLENKLHSQDQSIQTVHMMLNPTKVYDQKTKTAIGAQNPFYLRHAKKAQPALYDGEELLKTHHVPVIVPSSEEDLELAEITKIKMHEKMNDSASVEKRMLEKRRPRTKANAHTPAILNHLRLVTSMDAPEFDAFFELNEKNAQLQTHKNIILKLKAQISQLKDNKSDVSGTLLPQPLESQNFQLHVITNETVIPKVSVCNKYAIDVEPIPPTQRNNRNVQQGYLNCLKDTLDTLCEIVEEARSKRTSDNSLEYACIYTKTSQELLENVIASCPKTVNKKDR
ncbi:hypothetical protein Tco_1465723 [Tanacetum coccineum]